MRLVSILFIIIFTIILCTCTGESTTGPPEYISTTSIVDFFDKVVFNHLTHDFIVMIVEGIEGTNSIGESLGNDHFFVYNWMGILLENSEYDLKIAPSTTHASGVIYDIELNISNRTIQTRVKYPYVSQNITLPNNLATNNNIVVNWSIENPNQKQFLHVVHTQSEKTDLGRYSKDISPRSNSHTIVLNTGDITDNSVIGELYQVNYSIIDRVLLLAMNIGEFNVKPELSHINTGGIHFLNKYKINNLVNDNLHKDKFHLTISSFTASVISDPAVVVLNWKTDSEYALKGFHIYRNETDDIISAERINYSIISATNTSFPAQYSFLDYDVVVDRYYFYWLNVITNDGLTLFTNPVVVQIEVDSPHPSHTKITSIYPNPVRDSASFNIAVKQGETAVLSIYSHCGRIVKEYSEIQPGWHILQWDRRDSNNIEVRPGFYYYRLKSPSVDIFQRMLVFR